MRLATSEVLILAIDDIWLQLVGGLTMLLAMPLSVMVASLTDNSAEPAFPRWCGYTNGWLVLTMLPDQLLFFFHKGPFAWNGLFGIWIPVSAFAGFFIVNFLVVRKAIQRDQARILQSQESPLATTTD